jgi:RNA polymerase sigma-70 factor (ECF subfamily)
MMTPNENNNPSSSPPSPESTSTNLLRRVKAWDPEAWERLVDLYGPVAYRLCRQSGVKADDAADVVQEVFRAVAEHVSTFRRDRPADSFRAWLTAITRNKVSDHFRCLGRRAKAEGGTEAQQRLLEIAEPPDLSEPSTPPDTDGLLSHRALELVQAEFEPRTWQAFWRVPIPQR